MKNYLIHTLLTKWDEPPRARHQVSNELKKDGVVYFVECPEIGLPKLKIRRAEENVYVITPVYPVSYKIRYRISALNDPYQKWLFKKISELNITFEMVITFDYTAPVIHDFFNNVIFYCADDNVGFGKFNPSWVNSYHTLTEERVAQKAKLCIATSEYMGKKIFAYNSNTHVIPLGAPEVLINEPLVKKEKRELPVLALVGFLDSNMDEKLLFRLLEQFEILMIGPAGKKSMQAFSSYPKAKLMGVKTGRALHECLQEADVCIAPYDVNKLNKGATPNKLWLYLAAGKPGVITNMPNIENWKFEDKLLYRCTNDVFIEKCLQAYSEDSAEISRKRIQLAKESSWKYRIEKMKQLFYQQNTAILSEKEKELITW